MLRSFYSHWFRQYRNGCRLFRRIHGFSLCERKQGKCGMDHSSAPMCVQKAVYRDLDSRSTSMKSVAIFGAVALTALTASSFSAFSQERPTAAQKQALRSACPADYRANCAGVPTGGMAALVCLEQHVDKLSPPCQAAVKAVSGGSDETKSASAPASKPPAAKSPGQGQPAPAAAPASDRPVMPFFRELRLTARSCARDFRVLCPDVPLGHGNALFCLKVHADHLSEPCRAALVAAGEPLE